MKAILCPRYGSAEVLEFKDVERPVPQDVQLLIKVRAASVNALDQHLMRGEPFLVRVSGNGFRVPRDPRLGADLAGVVEAVGTNVSQFRPGDQVFGSGSGAFAEYACLDQGEVVLKPAMVTFEAAAAVPVAALTALQGLRDSGHIQPGGRVLIQGASGGVGTFAVQIAKSFGAEVTGVCSPGNVDMVRSIGADHVIDYTREDFTRKAERYDLILAVNGYHPIPAYRRCLTRAGTFVLVGEGSNKHLMRAIVEAMLIGPALSKAGGQRLGMMPVAKINQPDLQLLSDLMQGGKVVPVIDRRYPLSEAAQALAYFDEGHVHGKVVITVEDSAGA